MITRIALFVLVSAGIWTADVYFNIIQAPEQSAQNAVAAVNGGDQEAAKLRGYEWGKSNVALVCASLQAILAAACFAKPIKKALTVTRKETVHA